MIDEPGFHLEGIIHSNNDLEDFSGPLSLILILLQKNKVEIRDIMISDILDQYLEYLDKMQELDLEIASDFVRMASYLMYIKTKMMLSNDKEVTELEILIETLEQLKAKEKLTSIHEVTPLILDNYKYGSLSFSKKPEEAKGASDYGFQHSFYELLSSLRRVASLNKDVFVDIDHIRDTMPKQIIYSVKSKSLHILKKLNNRNVFLNELYSECSTKSEIVATFVSILELCSLGSISITMSKDGNDYELAFSGGNFEDIIEKIEE